MTTTTRTVAAAAAIKKGKVCNCNTTPTSFQNSDPSGAPSKIPTNVPCSKPIYDPVVHQPLSLMRNEVSSRSPTLPPSKSDSSVGLDVPSTILSSSPSMLNHHRWFLGLLASMKILPQIPQPALLLLPVSA
jgi:hypothetical protein